MGGDVLFDALRSKPFGLDLLTPAPRTGRRLTLPVATVMAMQVLQEFVIRQGHIAARTLWDPPACATLRNGRISSAILKQDHLLSGLERLPHDLQQPAAEMPLHVPLFVGLAEVHQFDVRQRRATEPLRQGHMGSPALLNRPARLQ